MKEDRSSGAQKCKDALQLFWCHFKFLIYFSLLLIYPSPPGVACLQSLFTQNVFSHFHLTGEIYFPRGSSPKDENFGTKNGLKKRFKNAIFLCAKSQLIYPTPPQNGSSFLHPPPENIVFIMVLGICVYIFGGEGKKDIYFVTQF